MKPPSEKLASALERFLDDVPKDVALGLCKRLEKLSEEELGVVTPDRLGYLTQPGPAKTFCTLVREWASIDNTLSGARLSGFLSALASVEERRSERQKVELLWTGPTVAGTSLRRTDQALLEVIQGARHQLLLVSFAVYKIKAVVAAMEEAQGRGVEIRLVLEDTKTNAPFAEMVKQFNLDGLRYFVWPEDKREKGPAGQRGVMHAKCAVADDQVLFLSSANLTESALSINMEMGLMVHGGDQPGKVHRHMGALIRDGYLVEVSL
jgi:cardiolipin synthase A/B